MTHTTTTPAATVTPGAPATGDRHAVVVGMHRSGTSAVAHTLAELGLLLPQTSDIIGAGPTNERGHWEARALVKFDEWVLHHLGGSWSAPPDPDPGWEASADPDTAALRRQASQLAAVTLARAPVVLKDPRLSLTLPLWRAVLDHQPCAVLVLRDPVDVARSLERRDGFPISLGLAVWDRYVRQATQVVAGLPVFVLPYAAALEEPDRWVEALADFLDACSIRVPPARRHRAAAVLSPDLRHHRADTRPDTSLAPRHRELLRLLEPLAGPHERWVPPALPEEPVWVADLIRLAWLGQCAEAGRRLAEDELTWIGRSRVFQAVTAFWRATRTGPALSPVPRR